MDADDGDDAVYSCMEMYEPLHDNDQQRLTGPVVYLRQSPVVCESYCDGQSTAAGIILIIAGVLSITFDIFGIVLLNETVTYFGHGLWCGIMVS